MTATLALSASELGQVKSILAAHLPLEARAGVFGSRAGGTPKPWSDLDLVIASSSPLPLSVLAAIAEAFDESSLPFKVDIVDRQAVSSQFGAIIDASMIALPRD